MTNRILLSSALLFSLAGSAAFAQAAAAPDQTQQAPQVRNHHQLRNSPHRAAVRMSKKLGLSPDQTAKLEPILAERQQKMQALKADTTLTDAQRKDQRRAIQQNTQSELSTVLTPDQMQQMKSMHKGKHHTADAAPSGV